MTNFSLLNSLILAAWILTFLRTILNLRLVPRLRPVTQTSGPQVSVIIPARNEESTIERTVRALLAQSWQTLEVIVADDRSHDATGAILERMAQEDSRLSVVAGSEPPPGWLGKPWALHQGSQVASGEVFLFIDADIVYEAPAVAAAVTHLQATGAAMLTLFPLIVMKSFWERVAMPMLALTVYSFFPTWLSNRTRIVRLGLGAGTGNMILRADYEAVGGHEALRDAVVDDVATARLLRRSGRRTTVARANDLVSVRMYAGPGAVLEGFTKNVFAAFDRSYLVTVLFIVLGFIFHVLPYGLAAAGDLISVATVGVITATRVMLFATLRYPISHAVLSHPLMMFFWSWIAIRSAWITGIRKQMAWRGRSYDADHTRFGG